MWARCVDESVTTENLGASRCASHRKLGPFDIEPKDVDTAYAEEGQVVVQRCTRHVNAQSASRVEPRRRGALLVARALEVLIHELLDASRLVSGHARYAMLGRADRAARCKGRPAAHGTHGATGCEHARPVRPDQLECAGIGLNEQPAPAAAALCEHRVARAQPVVPAKLDEEAVVRLPERGRQREHKDLLPLLAARARAQPWVHLYRWAVMAPVTHGIRCQRSVRRSPRFQW